MTGLLGASWGLLCLRQDLDLATNLNKYPVISFGLMDFLPGLKV